MDSRDVTREIRRVVWPVLRAEGFDSFTGRTAWRYVEETIDVVNFQSFSASLADSVGCTPFSFALNLGIWAPTDDEPRAVKPDAAGRVRPSEWECGQRTHLAKSIEQPLFEPFSRTETCRWPEALRTHREGLKRVFRTDRHDRDEIWYVLVDGSNLAKVVDDALGAIMGKGLGWFETARTVALRELQEHRALGY